MPTRRYASKAVEELRSWLSSNYGTYLTTINTEEGTTLSAPTIYRGAIHPFAVEPIALEVECESFRPEDVVNDYWFHDCQVHFVLRGADADVVAAQQNLRRYVSALIRALEANPTLGSTVVDAEIGETSFGGVGDEQLLFVATTQVTVKTHEA